MIEVPTYALTLWRPWPWAFFYPPPEMRKRLENRPWKPWQSIIGKRIALHAGKHWDAEGQELIVDVMDAGGPWTAYEHQWCAEGIIGTVRVVGWHARGTKEDTLSSIPEDQACWFFGPYAWICEDEELLPAPIPCKGRQGLWRIPENVRDQMRRAA